MTPQKGRAAYRRLFRAHLLGIADTGIATVALALLAYDLAGSEAGGVLGTALALKMAVDVIALPLVAGLTASLPTRGRLVRSMLARAALLLLVPLIDSVWQIYVLVILFQTASAMFVAVYLATVPELLPDDEDYARAVAKSKIAYDVESLVSPLLVAAALAFVGTREVFLIAALLLALAVPVLVAARFPPPRAPAEGGYRAYLVHVARFFAEPKLRGGLAITVAAIVIGAMVTVNTVVLVQGASASTSGRRRSRSPPMARAGWPPRPSSTG
jgi:MFS family permease